MFVILTVNCPEELNTVTKEVVYANNATARAKLQLSEET